jgi:hypothetical protein
MWWFIQKFWILLVTAATLVGIFYIPVDIREAREAGEPYAAHADLVTQTSALGVFDRCSALHRMDGSAAMAQAIQSYLSASGPEHAPACA